MDITELKDVPFCRKYNIFGSICTLIHLNDNVNSKEIVLSDTSIVWKLPLLDNNPNFKSSLLLSMEPWAAAKKALS